MWTFVVSDITKPDSVTLNVGCCIYWAFKVIGNRGFKYKTVGFTWAKTNKNTMGFFTGLGYWTRGDEMCLLATKGRPKEYIKMWHNWLCQKDADIRKPLLHKDIERLVDGHYIELFARKKTRKLGLLGNEV